jgi:uncharacterized damage-inducible protein DinB
MEPPASFVVEPPPGFAPVIGRLVAELEYVRWTTVRAVDGLTQRQLDHCHDAASNSIGALLAHIAAVEVAHHRLTFASVPVSPALEAELAIAERLGDDARRTIVGRPLEHYLATLREVRSATLAKLAERDDAWLTEPAPLELLGGRPANKHIKWFHVAEYELNHRGQIRWLRQRLPAALDPAITDLPSNER